MILKLECAIISHVLRVNAISCQDSSELPATGLMNRGKARSKDTWALFLVGR